MRGKGMPLTVMIILLSIIMSGCTSAGKENAPQNQQIEAAEGESAGDALSDGDLSEGEMSEDEISEGGDDNSGNSEDGGSEVVIYEDEFSNDEEFDGEYKEVEVQIFKDELTDQTVPIRFYKETPHVAYMGVSEYFDLMLGGGLVVEDHGDGSYTLTNPGGATAEVDTVKGTVSSEDMPSFENYYEDAKKGAASSFRDSTASYLRLREVVYEGDPSPVVFDLGSLGIAIHGDSDEVWLPVSIVTTWLTDIAQNRVVYNGRYLYVCRGSDGYEQDKTFYDTRYIEQILTGQDRKEDLTSYSYGELGFIFRYMYGYPGRTKLDDAVLREQGLDAALKTAGDNGAKLAGDLSSRDFRDFWFGMYSLSGTVLEDGHNNTALNIGVIDAENTDKYSEFRAYTWERFDDASISEFTLNFVNAMTSIYDARPTEYADSKYYKSGDTAFILLASFSVDTPAWELYYEQGGELPDDTMGDAARGLQKASEDGEIRNVVIDLSTNGGGYSDAAMGVLSLMTGRDYLCGYNELTGQNFKVYFDVDRNLDGKFDEKDEEVHYDFNYGALTSRASFSCGNMFPYLVRDEGGMVIGERSGGGSCSIQKAVLSEGFEISISGCKFKLKDKSGSDLEKGVAPDVELEIPMVTQMNGFTGKETQTPDYSSYKDLNAIAEAVSGWFAK